MTREEAIKIINCYDIGFYDLSGEKIPADKLAEAFDMAIEALTHDKHTETHDVRFDLILCKECKYYRPEFDACTVKGWNLSATHYPKVHESGFCYRGERRSE